MSRDLRKPDPFSPSTLVDVTASPTDRSRAILMVVGGQQTGRVLTISSGPSVTLGRSARATHVIEEPSVSGVHARIIRAEPHFILVDENATNGTFLNGHRVVEPMPLEDGDRVQLGPIVAL